MRVYLILFYLTLVIWPALTVAASLPSFVAHPCADDYSELSQNITCGTLVEAENPNDKASSKVGLPVVVVKALQPVEDAAPVIFLHGGPGSHAVTNVRDMLTGARNKPLIARDQDWIFFDQRGGRRATPNLNCPDVEMTDAGPVAEQDVQALIACGHRFKASGIDLNHYNALQSAADIQSLRKALDIGEYHLFGYSNGTRVALTTMDHYPDELVSVVVDSVWPREATWTEGTPTTLANAVRGIIKHCQLNQDCQQRYPELEAHVEALAKRFLAAPQAGSDGRLYPATALGAFLMDSGYAKQAISFLPQQLEQMYQGNYQVLESFELADYRSTGAHIAYLCHDEIGFESKAQVARNAGDDPIAQLAVKSLENYFDVCAAYDIKRGPVREAQPVKSRIPTLFVSAEIDPGCPPEFAEATASHFDNGQFVMVPNTTHGVFLESPCARSMVRQFLINPKQPVDRACLAN